MNCPSCKQGYLKPIKITDGLPAMACNQCQGYLLSMLSYRLWIENNPQLLKPESKLELLDETTQVVICPKCQVLMTKYRISGATQNKLDSCGNCGELWIDNGEWELLLSLGIAGRLSSILATPWQKNIHQQQSESNYEQRFKDLLGSEEYQKLRDFRDWIKQHKHQQELTSYMARINR